MHFTCRICGSRTSVSPWVVPEVMYRTGEEFDYVECPDCGCLQISIIPSDLSRHYPSTYYSFRSVPRSYSRTWRIILGFLFRAAVIDSWCRPLIRPFIQTRFPIPYLMGSCGLTLGSRILDVGSGGGRLVTMLRQGGFRNAFGLDPFIPSNIYDEAGELICHAQSLERHDGLYHLIMFNHSFEHVPDPLQTLLHARRLCEPKGVCLIRIPTVSSWAWGFYRTNWCQLDAPRHLHLHSTESIRHLALSAGFIVQRMICDSTALQFWGSERVANGLSLTENMGADGNPLDFQRRQVAGFRKRARQLNRAGVGDQLAVFLKPA